MSTIGNSTIENSKRLRWRTTRLRVLVRFGSLALSLGALAAAVLRSGVAYGAEDEKPSSTSATATSARRPNIVVFLADDQGWGDLSIHGNRQLSTPNIDVLARAGAAVERFFVCALCAPTRAEFLTGRYHPRGGVRGVSTGLERLDADERTLADALRAAGYATGAFGKWHNGSQWPYHPNARGFDEYYGFTAGHWGEYYNAPLERNGRPVRGNGFIADDFTTQAIQFIETRRDRPFFCYVAFNTPHSPYCVPEKYWSRFKDKPIEQRGADGDRETIDATRATLAMCENIDDNVGRVLAKLDEWKLADDTIVVYFSDNGPNTTRWNGGMKGKKGQLDEGGLRSPLHIRWPGKIKAGTQVTPICGAIDLMPTLLSLAGLPPAASQPHQPRPLDGRDLSPLLLASDASRSPPAWPDDRLLFSYLGGRVTVRTQQHRLDPAGGLFDMLADPNQTTNVARHHPEVVERLTNAVAAWKKDVLADFGNDDRPYPIGYREFPRAWLPARDGVPHGKVRRSTPAPNCSYFVNWTSVDDRITWDVDVHETGDYLVTLHYTCRAEDVGATIEFQCGDARMTTKIDQAWDPPLITDQDVIKRPPAESIMKEFRPLGMGVVRLEKGRREITLQATQIPGRQAIDLRGIDVTLQP